MNHEARLSLNDSDELHSKLFFQTWRRL